MINNLLGEKENQVNLKYNYSTISKGFSVLWTYTLPYRNQS